MRRNLPLAAFSILAVATVAAAQGGRGRAAQASQRPAAAAVPAGPGLDAGTAPRATDFYNFDPGATTGRAFTDAPPVETHQKIEINGQSLSYTARAGHLALSNPTTGQSEAHVFYTSYTREAVTDPSARPIVFFLGGAPGVAAAWQDLGGLGPKRIRSAALESGPYLWADNPNTLLTHADLVFVNPVGTAFSRPDRPDRGPAFWDTAGDTASLGQFVEAFLSRDERRSSPLYLAAEDSATGRAASLAAWLVEHQYPVQGVVLLSVNLSPDAEAGDARFLTQLPSLILAAWHHKKLAPDLNAMSSEQIAGHARQLASREYLHALYEGDRMTAGERAKLIADLSRMTGVSKAFIVNNDLRLPLDRFSAELLRDQQRGLSYSDSRVSGFLPAPAPAGRGGRGAFPAVVAPPVDFNLSYVSGPFRVAYEDYLRRELSFKDNQPGVFYLMGGGVAGFNSTGNDAAGLSAAFARQPRLRLFVVLNYFDLESPFYAAEFTLAHLNISPEARAHNITVSHLEAGQMPYLDSKALVKLHADLAVFLSPAAK